MATIYVRSTDGSNTDDGSTWALAKLDLAGAAAIDAAGDTVYVSQSHAESTASAITITLEGTASNPVKLLCANDGAEPPTSAAATATVTTTGASSITLNGSLYSYGIDYSAGNGSSNASINLASSTSTDTIQTFENTDFTLGGNNSSGSLVIGGNASSNTARSAVVWRDVDVKFSNLSHRLEIYQRLHWRGGSILSGSTAVTFLLRCGAQGRGSPILIEGVDLSNLGSAAHLVNGPQAVGLVTFRNCKLPASWTGSLITGAIPPGLRAEMYNCDNADTNYRLWVEDYAGSVKTETTIVRSGGANDGTTTYSWKMASSSSATYPTFPLVSPDLPARWNTTVGSSVTVDVDIVHDSVTNLTDAEVWLQVQYLGTSGYPISTFVSDCKADPVTAAADQTTSSATWTTTGLTNPNKQKLSVTFTPQEAGYIQARVLLAKASKTVYVDPKLQVS